MPPRPKKKNNNKKFRETKNLLIFVVHRSAFVCCCLSRFLCGLLILDIFLARRSERSVIMSRRGAGFDGRLSLRLLNRGRLCATLRDSSRNSLCGQLIGRSVALSGARRTHCWGVPNAPNWHFLWFFPWGGGAKLKTRWKRSMGWTQPHGTWFDNHLHLFLGVTTRCQSYLCSCCFVQSRNVTTSIYGHA